MKVLIIGSNGRLGAALARAYSNQHQVQGLNRAAADLADPASLEKTLDTLDFEAVVNCAAMTSVDLCESRAEEAYNINAKSVRVIAEAAKRRGARFIHISTDYVFDGTKHGPYTESDPARPTGVYAASKRQGEIECLETDPANVVVRVSWVFGPDRPSFLDMIIRRAQQNDRVEAIGDKYSCPGYSLDYAEWLAALLFGPSERWAAAGGLLHLCNTGATTWRDYGEYALQCAQEAGLPLRTTKVEYLMLKDMDMFVAPRPVNTAMSTRRFSQITGLHPRPWQDAVRDYVFNYLAKDPELAQSVQ